MREILFRAKRIDNGEWVEGYYLKTTLGKDIEPSDVIFVPFKINRSGQWGWIKVLPETLCQFTGMVDKNGRRIWENDIVSCEHEKYPEDNPLEVYPLFPEPVKYNRNYAVEFINTGSSYGYRLRNKSIHFMITGNVIYNHKIEAIGNVFDNPELLKGDAE
mgnify:CR=1 FL=1